MAFFHRSARVVTTLSPAAVRERLGEHVERRGLMAVDLGATKAHPFRGTVDADGFRLVRRVQWRNSFAPVAKGTLTPLDTGTQVDISLDLHGAVFGFLVAWTLLAGAGAYVLISSVFELTVPIALAAMTFPLLGVVVGYLGFELEAPKTLAELEAILREPPAS